MIFPLRRRHTRGYILLYGLLVLSIVIGAVFMLASAANARAQTEKLELQRQAALSAAESALEQARSALAAGNLKPGATQSFAGTNVSCAPAGTGVQLEALVRVNPSTATARQKRPEPAVRVRWTLAHGDNPAAANVWSIAEWHVQNETLP